MGIKAWKVKVKSEFICCQNGRQLQEEPKKFSQSCWGPQITPLLLKSKIKESPSHHCIQLSLFMSDTWNQNLSQGQKCLRSDEREEAAGAAVGCLKISSPKELFPLFSLHSSLKPFASLLQLISSLKKTGAHKRTFNICITWKILVCVYVCVREREKERLTTLWICSLRLFARSMMLIPL